VGGVKAEGRGEERSGFPCAGPVELVGNSFFELSIKSIRPKNGRTDAGTVK